MRAAFQMDHPSRLNASADSTFMLIEEGARRGVECFFYEPHHLSWQNGELLAQLQPISLSKEAPHYKLGTGKTMPLSKIDVVWMRQDPPFNMRYITATHLLESAGTRVVNDPKGVRNAPEKLVTLALHELMPPTLISADPTLVHTFAAKHGTVVAKPLHGYGGRSVFRFTADDPNIDTLLEQWGESVGEPLMWQKFLPEVSKSDTRIILIDGEVAGIFSREPPAGSIRANMRVGGVPKKAEITARQQKVCDKIAPKLKKNGLLFVGLDMIGEHLTEINVTSPTGLRAVQKLYGMNLAARLWDKIG